MAKRKKTATKKRQGTTYQRKTRRISRWRSFKRSASSFFRRGYYAVAAASITVAIGMAWWWVHSGKLTMMVDETQQSVLQQTAHAGMELKYIYLEGRDHANLDEVTSAIGLEAGDPILGVSVDGIKERLKALNWVKDAVVERQLPDTLHVHIIERMPIAVWQHKGELKLVDQGGEIIRNADGSKAEYGNLLLVVGEDAPETTVELMRMLNAEPELFVQISSAIRVGNRRWDVRFRNGIEAKLPAQNPERAWAMLAEMERQQHLLARNIRAVDLRLEDRMFIDLPPEAKDFIINATSARDA
ncbi:MAG: FtsQ-type POTRA domain-containing protein [Alphaproteobacteria bacterium]|nr:FtsQ-type POTRA domain-containing protein [Alphaproteobacteria bacterium]